jgi:hypothetical protein
VPVAAGAVAGSAGARQALPAAAAPLNVNAVGASRALRLASSAQPSATNAVENLRNILTFNPPTLSMAVSLNGDSFHVSLNRPPKNTVTVSFGTSGFVNLDKCQLTFTPQNFSMPQLVRAFPAGAIGTQSQLSGSIRTGIKARIISGGENGIPLSEANAAYPVQRQFKAPKTCVTAGDPHFQMFNGQGHDFQGVNQQVYYLVKSPRLTVLARHSTACGFAPTLCNEAIAMRYGNSVILVSTTRNQNSYDLKILGSKSGLLITRQTKDNLVVRSEDGALVTMTIHPTYIDAVVEIPGSYENQVSGLCGGFTKSLPEAGGASNAVPANENLFICQDKCASNVAPIPEGNKCVIVPAKLDPVNPTSSSIPKTPVVSKTPVTNVVINPPIIPTNQAGETCDVYCNRMFGGLDCAKVNKKFYISSCTRDCKIIGHERMKTVAENLMQTFQRECGIQVMMLSGSSLQKDKDLAKDLMKKFNIRLESDAEIIVISSGKVESATVQGPNTVLPSGK